MGVLRLFLALTVVLSHSGVETFVGSRNAVQMFYIVSGFLISYVLNHKEAYSSLFNFYTSRFLRIYPIYFLVALAAIFFPFYGGNVAQLYKSIPNAAEMFLVLSNIFIFGQDWVMFLGVKADALHFTGNFRDSDYLLFQGLLVPQAWSLGVELCFYLIAPFVLKRRMAVVFVFLSSCFARTLFYLTGHGAADPWTYRFFPFELALFMLGSISQHFFLPFWRRVQERMAWSGLGGVIFLVMACVLFQFNQVSDLYKSVVLFAVFAMLLPLAFIFQGGSRTDRFLGELSYPVYVGHLLVFSLVASGSQLVGGLSAENVICTNVIATLIFALLLKYGVADPVERIRSKIGARNCVPAVT